MQWTEVLYLENWLIVQTKIRKIVSFTWLRETLRAGRQNKAGIAEPKQFFRCGAR